VQEAFANALKDWTYRIPENPAAWLMTTAKNKAVDVVRRQRYQKVFAKEVSTLLKSEYTTAAIINQLFLDHEIQDSQLRMIFACCHPQLAEADQLALTLKTCSGFSTHEIASALLTNHEHIKKRLQRAKLFIVEHQLQFDIPSGDELKQRQDSVMKVLYPLFNEGYNSSSNSELIRKDLCEEAMRLCLLITQHAYTKSLKAHALMALMTLLVARFDSRLDAQGEIILLHEQDRTKWNKELIAIGLNYLSQSSEGNDVSEYHLQAAIFAEHIIALDFEATNWKHILVLYDSLLQLNPSPIVRLNREIVFAKLNGPQAAIENILAIENINHHIETNYIFAAALADLYSGEKDKAAHYLHLALSITKNEVEKRLLRKKIDLLANSTN